MPFHCELLSLLTYFHFFDHLILCYLSLFLNFVFLSSLSLNCSIFSLYQFQKYTLSVLLVVTLDILSSILNSKSKSWSVSLPLSQVYKNLTAQLALITSLLANLLLLFGLLGLSDFFTSLPQYYFIHCYCCYILSVFVQIYTYLLSS